MGRGDKRTKRGKISRGSFGKSRPKINKQPKPSDAVAAKATATTTAPAINVD